MSKFDDLIDKLTTARGAETSLKWFAEIEEVPAVISITAEVRWASSTSEGKAAQVYVYRAAKELIDEILERAELLARTDLAIGEKLL